MLIGVITLITWSYTARQLRAQALSLRGRDFLEAARVRGERSLYIIVVEIIPTMTSLLVASFLTNALYAVLFSSSLQFIGLGNPNQVSWGTMLYWAENEEAFQTGQALWILIPGLCIVALGAAFALLNYAFDEIGNPALRPVKSMRRVRVKPARADDPRRRPGPASARVRTSWRSRTCRWSTCWSAAISARSRTSASTWRPAEFLGIVGESGCGKSSLLFAIAQLLTPPAAISSGSVTSRAGTWSG